jgi:hypothetical protein
MISRSALVVTLVAVFALVALPLCALAQSAAAMPLAAAPEASTLAGSTAPLFGVALREELSDANARTLAAQAGAHWARTSIAWSSIEPVQGVRNFAWPDQLFSTLQASGLTPIVYVSGNPSWAASSGCGPLNRVPLSALADFLGALAERYDGDGDYNGDSIIDGPALPDVQYWQLYNEPDSQWTSGEAAGYGGCWGASGAKYAKLLALAWTAVHTANANAKLVFGGIAAENVDCLSTWTCAGQKIFNFNINGGDFVDTVLSYMVAHPDSTYFDVFDFHYYAAFHAMWDQFGSGIIGKAQYYKTRLASKGISRPMICTEASRRSDPGQIVDGVPGSDEEQSRAVVRTFVQSSAAGLQALTWFSFADVSTPGQGGWAGWGLVSVPSFEPKPSYNAYKTLTRQLATATYVAPLALNAAAEGYLYSVPGTGDRSVIWSKSTATVNVSFLGSTLHVSNKYGVAKTYTDGQTGDQDGFANGAIVLAIGPSPIYIDGRPGTLPPPYVKRVNAGGGLYKDTHGVSWTADKAYVAGNWGSIGGVVRTTTAAIANTVDDPLYQVDRTFQATADPGYAFTVPNGVYTVTLKFAETVFTAANQRKFNVKINGVTVLSGFDIFAQAQGSNKAIDKVMTTSVSNGLLTVSFIKGTGNPKVNAIEIRQRQ